MNYRLYNFKSKLLIMGCIAMLSIMTSCGDNEIETPDPALLGYDYFPLEVGNEWVYRVDSVLVANLGLANVVSSSFVKEEIVELISNSDDEKIYKIERSYKKDSISQWRLTDVWSVRINNSQAIRTEGNLSFIKLVFPAVDGTKWDGNAFFDSDKSFPVAAENLTIYMDWSYRISDLESHFVGGTLYNDVKEVSHIDEETFISKRFSSEVYAKGVGLIERNMEIYDTQNGDDTKMWLDRAEKGFFLSQALVSFTKN